MEVLFQMLYTVLVIFPNIQKGKQLKGTNTQHSGHMGQIFQTELMAEIYSKSLV